MPVCRCVLGFVSLTKFHDTFACVCVCVFGVGVRGGICSFVLVTCKSRRCGEAHNNTEKFAIFIQCHINIVKLNTFIKLFSATNILK